MEIDLNELSGEQLESLLPLIKKKQQKVVRYPQPFELIPSASVNKKNDAIKAEIEATGKSFKEVATKIYGRIIGGKEYYHFTKKYGKLSKRQGGKAFTVQELVSVIALTKNGKNPSVIARQLGRTSAAISGLVYKFKNDKYHTPLMKAAILQFKDKVEVGTDGTQMPKKFSFLG